MRTVSKEDFLVAGCKSVGICKKSILMKENYMNKNTREWVSVTDHIPHVHHQKCWLNHLHVKQRQSLKQNQLVPRQLRCQVSHKPKKNNEYWKKVKIINKLKGDSEEQESSKKERRKIGLPDDANHEIQCSQYTSQVFSWQGLNLPAPSASQIYT